MKADFNLTILPVADSNNWLDPGRRDLLYFYSWALVYYIADTFCYSSKSTSLDCVNNYLHQLLEKPLKANNYNQQNVITDWLTLSSQVKVWLNKKPRIHYYLINNT